MECVSIHDLRPELEQLQSGDWFIVDVDDTLITPQALMFRPSSPFCALIDDLKKAAPPNLAEIVSTWRLSRKTMLVEQEWPAICAMLKNKGVTVIALTSMHTGTFGKISSMEQWRANELKSLGITFSPFATETIEVLIDSDQQPATLHQGILFTGAHPKSDVLKSFMAMYGLPSKIFFFDDRLAQIELLQELCKEMNIPYKGYHYQAVTKLPYNSATDYGAIQTKALLDHCHWLEDEDVKEIQAQ
jgi:hypothetical protein